MLNKPNFALWQLCDRTAAALHFSSAKSIYKTLPSKQRDDFGPSDFAVVDATTDHSDRAMISVNGLVDQSIFRRVKVDVQYPEIPALIPAGEPKAVMRVNPALLLDALKVAMQFANFHDLDSCELKYFGKNRPILIELVTPAQTLTVAVAPQREEEE